MNPFQSILLLLFLALPVGRLCAQPISQPHMRWLAGGTFLGPNLVRFSADGTSVFTHGAADLGLKKWDFASQQLLSLTPIPNEHTATAGLSHDEQRVALLSSHGSVLHLCRIEDGSTIWSNTVAGLAPLLRFSTNDSLLLSLGYPGVLQVWRVANGERLGTTFADSSGNESNVFLWAEFLNEAEVLAVGQGEVARFNAETGCAAWRTLSPSFYFSRQAAISSDGTEFCVVTTNGLRRYSTSTGEMIADVYEPPAGVFALAYSPDGATLAVALEENGVELRNLTNGVLQRTLGGVPESEWTIHALDWSSDGQHLLGGGVYGSYFWSLTGNTNAQPFIPLVRAHRTPARFSHDDKWIVKGCWPDDVVLLNATNGVVEHRWTLQPEADVEEACPSPVTNTVLVPTWDGDVQIRSLPEGNLLSTVNLFTNAGSAPVLEFSEDGSRLLAFDPHASFDERFAVFAIDTWQKLREGTDSGVTRARITSDGTKVITSGFGETLVWNVDDDSPPLMIPAGGDLHFGSEPDEVWTINRDGWLDLWRFTDGTRLGGVKIPLTNYTAVLSPDQRLILTSQSGRQPLQVWRTDDGELIGQLGGPTALQLIRFTPAPGNRWLVATRRDGALLAFDFPFYAQDLDLSGGQLHLSVLGAPGPFQLESSSFPDAGWETMGEPFEEATSVALPNDPARYFRASR